MDDHPPVSTGGRHAKQSGIVPASYFRWKGTLDFCLTVVMLVPGLLLIGLLVALVRITSRGPGIYRQARVGKDGHRFLMYKIRTMRHDAEAATGPVWTQLQDPRVTLVGKVLRKLHLDELPQLFNVLKGEMSLVGPRPERPEFVRVLAGALPGYRNRLAVKPGVTGLAQINLPPDTDLVSVQRKLVLDCEYIERGGVWLDARLIFFTFLRIFKISESWLHSVLGLRCGVEIAELPSEAAAAVSIAASSQATPASILLQIASLPDCGQPAVNGEAALRDEGQDHASNRGGSRHNGNGAPHRMRSGNRRGVRSEHGKPR
jgi:lipopolysaccharide/colanic/teichoic acid biosynthesis glycosyltransferase